MAIEYFVYFGQKMIVKVANYTKVFTHVIFLFGTLIWAINYKGTDTVKQIII